MDARGNPPHRCPSGGSLEYLTGESNGCLRAIGESTDPPERSVQFGCGNASIDALTFTGASFTAVGTHTRGSGIQPPPGMGPRPEPATFTGRVSGDTLSLKMKVDGDTSTMTFTKNRRVNLILCL